MFGLSKLAGHAWLAVNGWTAENRAMGVERAVVIAAPHTSNWDLPFSLAGAAVLGVRINWVGKHTLFEPKLWGAFMRWLGGVAVDRRKTNSNSVKAIANVFEHQDRVLLLVAPEGTRGAGKRWKSGFYWIAEEAKVPIVLGYVDYKNKRVGLGPAIMPSGDLKRDFAKIAEFYKDIEGKVPSKQSPVVLGDEERPPQHADVARAAN